jgi:hypothetical protein
MTVTTAPIALAYLTAKDLRPLFGSRALFFITFGLVVFAVAPCGQCQTGMTTASASGLMQDGERQLEEGRSSLDEPTLAAARKVFEECIRRDGENPLCYYELARTDSYLTFN